MDTHKTESAKAKQSFKYKMISEIARDWGCCTSTARKALDKLFFAGHIPMYVKKDSLIPPIVYVTAAKLLGFDF